MKFIDVWYLIVTEKEIDVTDEDSDIIFKSYVDGMWDNYDTALSYIKAVRDSFRKEPIYDKVKNERFYVGSACIDYVVSVDMNTYEFKVRKKSVTITDKD